MEEELRAAITSSGQILGALFVQDPREPEAQILLEALGRFSSLEEWPFASQDELDEAYALLSEGIARPTEELAKEYQRLFIGPHHFKAPAWGSVYLDRESVLFGSSTLELRQWMREQGIRINEDKREPEDHIGKMLLLLGWLAAEKPDVLPEFLAAHLMPWAPRYLELLYADSQQPFYQGLALLTRVTLMGITDELGVKVVEKKLYR
jgi:TorA maturation chaperone TorD